MEGEARTGERAITFVIGVGLLIVGYTLIDWGNYVVQGKRVSMWYLISGQTQSKRNPAVAQIPPPLDFNVTGTAVQQTMQNVINSLPAVNQLKGQQPQPTWVRPKVGPQ